MKTHVDIKCPAPPVQPIVGTVTIDVTANQAKLFSMLLNHAEWYRLRIAGIADTGEMGELRDAFDKLSETATMSTKEVAGTMFSRYRD